MRLNYGDEIQVEGIHPYNPITQEVIPAYLQIFALTRTVEGDTIPLDALHPRPDERFGVMTSEPLRMNRIVRLNGRAVRRSDGVNEPTNEGAARRARDVGEANLRAIPEDGGTGGVMKIDLGLYVLNARASRV